jgi:hypothetical protein
MTPPSPQFPRRTHRARAALEAWSSAHTGIWRLVDEIRQARRHEWPPYVFLSLEAAGEVMARYAAARGERPASVEALTRQASFLALFAAWRMMQGIYRFDPALYAALAGTPVSGEIPGELLRRLPEWCVYVETPDMTAPLIGGGATRLHGVWAWLDCLPQAGGDVLTVGLDTDEAGIAVGHVPLVGTLDEALDQVERDWRDAAARGNASGLPPEGYAEAARGTVGPLLSLLLYLCADEAEIGDGRARPANPEPKRTRRHGWRLFPADGPRTWDVGVRLGAALRRGYQRAEVEEREVAASGRARPRPHIRRAHWHTFLAGAGRAERRLKWLPPIPVNLGDLGDLPATIRRVIDE